MYNFVIVTDKKKATLKSNRDVLVYACKLSRIDISESTATLYNISIEQAEQTVKFVEDNNVTDIAIELQKEGFKDKAILKLLEFTLKRKYRKVLNIKKIEFLENQPIEDKMETLVEIEEVLSLFKGKMSINKPTTIIITEDLDGLYENNNIHLSVTQPILMCLSHEMAHAYDDEITHKWCSNTSVFYPLDLSIDTDTTDSMLNSDLECIKNNEKAKKDRLKFLKKINHIKGFNVKDNKDKIQFEQHKDIVQKLHKVLESHPLHQSGYQNKKEWFARSIEQYVKFKTGTDCSSFLEQDHLPIDLLNQYSRLDSARKDINNKDKECLAFKSYCVQNSIPLSNRQAGINSLQKDLIAIKNRAEAIQNQTDETKQAWIRDIAPLVEQLLKCIKK